MNRKLLATIQVVFFASLFALLSMAIARTEGQGWFGQLTFFMSGGLVALLAFGLVFLLSRLRQALGEPLPKQDPAVTVAFYSFCGALVGLLSAIYISPKIGGLVCVSSIVVGGCSVLWGMSQIFGERDK